MYEPLMRFLLAVACCLGATTGPAMAQDAGTEFFEKKIRPVLVDHCYKCHSHQAAKLRGELYLDSRDGVRKGGATGPAVVPSKPGDSLILQALRHSGKLRMPLPPAEKLPDAVIADFETWIAMGAPDPRDSAKVTSPPKEDHWAYRPLRETKLPPVKNVDWATSSMDRFILAKLEAQGLTPSPKAD